MVTPLVTPLVTSDWPEEMAEIAIGSSRLKVIVIFML